MYKGHKGRKVDTQYLIEYELIDRVNEQSKIIEELETIAKKTDQEILESIQAKLQGHVVGV